MHQKGPASHNLGLRMLILTCSCPTRLSLDLVYTMMCMPLQVVKVFERILYAADEKEAKEAMEQVLEEYNQQQPTN